jgi:hypothetical protein
MLIRFKFNMGQTKIKQQNYCVVYFPKAKMCERTIEWSTEFFLAERCNQTGSYPSVPVLPTGV